MKIDLTCPAEVWRYELPKEDFAACGLTLCNLFDKVIVSLEATLIILDGEGGEKARLIYRAHDLHGEPNKTFAMNIPVEEDCKGCRLEIIIEKVWYDDNSVWRRGRGPMTEYESNAMPSSPALERLRFVAGKDAVGYPRQQEGIWLCVCGRPNADMSRTCVRCGRDKEETFAHCSRDAVENKTSQRERQLALKGKAAREDASRLQLQREAAYNARRKKRRRIIALAAAVVLAAGAAYGGVFHLWPYLRYQGAVKQLEAGSWSEARAVFADMGEYRDAAEYLLLCEYQTGKELLASGEDEKLSEARKLFIGLGDYEDAADMVREADYLRAGLMVERGALDDASALYASLEKYKDSEKLVIRCAYLKADALLQAGQYGGAYEAFVALGDYEDSADKANQALYMTGKAAMESGDTDKAIELFSSLNGYLDTEELLKQTYYMKAEKLLAGGQEEAAGNAYLLAGDYADAADKASLCIYKLAEQAAGYGDEVRAAELYGKILTYADAADKWQASTYRLAQRAIKDTEYAMARDLLAQLPEDYQDVAKLRLECVYLPAKASYARGDDLAAVEGFTQLGDYRDSVAQLRKARYRLGGKLLESGDYAGAIAQFEQLGSYKESKKQLRTARYQQALLLLDEKQYAAAAELFTLLDGYKDSADRLKAANFGQAEELLAAGKADEARAIFEGLGKYAGAKEKVLACDYLSASALADAGRKEESAAAFEALADYADAADRARQLWYALGQESAAEGKVTQAARYFEQAGDYEDAAAQAERIYDSRYQQTAADAQEAFDRGEYALAAQLLTVIDRENLPEKYLYLNKLYRDACYQEAERLYGAGKPYEALPYYQALPEDSLVRERLNSDCYLILGRWVDENGQPYEFRADGTCTMAGEALCFNTGAIAMETGTAPETLRPTHRISSVNEREATLYDNRDGETKIIRLTRVKDGEPAPAPTETPAAEEGLGVDFVVVDE